MTSQPNSDRPGQSVTSFGEAVVFANLKAGGGKASRYLPILRQVFADQGTSVEFRNTSSLSDLEKQALEAIGQGAKLLFAVGGDGTLQGLVNAAYGQDVILGVVPAGGGNDFARALGLPRNSRDALRAALSGEPRVVDLAKVRMDDGKQRFFLGGGGVGLDADTAELSSGWFRNWPGRSRYIASAVCAYARYKPRLTRVKINSSEVEIPWQNSILASVLNTPTFGAGIRLAPCAQIEDGLLDFAFLDELSLGRLLRILPSLASRGTLELPNLRTFQFHKLRIETDPPAYFHGDGELLGSTPVEIEVAAGGAKFLAPKLAQT